MANMMNMMCLLLVLLGTMFSHVTLADSETSSNALIDTANSTTGRPACSRGWTGPDSGGSCSFNKKTLCDWSNTNPGDFIWELKRTRIILSPNWNSDPEKSTLQGPLMCEASGQPVCVEVRFRFSDGGDMLVYLEACGTDSTCTELFRYVFNGNTDWHVYAVQFLTPGYFELSVVGEKYYDGYFGESDIFIDYIRYNHTSCGQKADKVISLTSTTMAPTTESESATASGRLSSTSTLSSSPALVTSARSSSPDTTDWSSTAQWTTEREVGVVDMSSTSQADVSEEEENQNMTMKGHMGDNNNNNDNDSDNNGKKADDDDNDDDDKQLMVMILIVCGVLVIVLVVASVTVVVIVKRRRTSAFKSKQASSARYDRNESITVVNELYGFTGIPTSDTDEDTANETGRQSTTKPMTSQDRTSHSSDVSHSSAKRPLSSPAAMTVDKYAHHDRLPLLIENPANPKPSEDKPYENTKVYENMKANKEDKVYENSEADVKVKADDTYEAVDGEKEGDEYNHLMNPNNRPDRRLDTYDRADKV